MSTTQSSKPLLSISTMVAEREASRVRESEAEQELRQKQAEELAAYKKRLDEFKVTDAHREMVVQRLKRAFERGETELMMVPFPSSLCTDGGRAVNNADAPPLLKPDPAAKTASGDTEPAWLTTLPRGARPIYEFWKQELQSGGFKMTARILSYPGGIPGDTGLFFSWFRGPGQQTA